MTPATAVTLEASAAQTATGQGSSLDLGTAVDTLRLTLDVTAVAGTSPTLLVTIQTSSDGAAWRNVKSFTARNAVGQEALVFVPVDRYVRAIWTIGGTGGPSFTFSLAGEKLKPYANVAYFRKAHSGGVFATATDEHLEPYLAASSVEFAGYFGGRYGMPLLSWGDDVRKKVCSHAAWGYMSEKRGFNPESPADAVFRMNYDDAINWLKLVMRNDINPPGIVDSTPDKTEEFIEIVTETSRGW